MALLLGARRSLDWLRHRHPGQDLEPLTAEHVLAAVEYRLSLSATSYIRTFLHFLHWAGHHEQDLAAVVPRTPRRRLAHLAPRLSWDDVCHAIDAIGAATPIDLRDRAILLLLATTAIRNGELRVLLQDIDWRAGEFFVRRTKGKRDRVAPLLEQTGAALPDYILRARPKVDSPYLFLSFTPWAVQVRVACFEDRAEAVAAWRDQAPSRRRRASPAPLSGHPARRASKADQRGRRSFRAPKHQHNG